MILSPALSAGGPFWVIVDPSIREAIEVCEGIDDREDDRRTERR